MKTIKLLSIVVILMLTAFTVIAQNVADKQANITDKKALEKDIPFGQKLPPPDLPQFSGKTLSQNTYAGIRQNGHATINDILRQSKNHPDINAMKKDRDNYRQQLIDRVKQQTSQPSITSSNPGASNVSPSDFNSHLVKDINALAESLPNNYSDPPFTSYSFAILKNVAYFFADDGVHGSELWRSDGTAEGTYLVKDIEPGEGSSLSYAPNITAIKDKIYFSAYTTDYGYEPWVSDGTVQGTHMLKDIMPGIIPSFPTEFIAYKNDVYFVADGYNGFWDAVWKTDGTSEGTQLAQNMDGFWILFPTKSNGLLFFSFISFSSGAWELWRTDGTKKGTYHIGTNAFFNGAPVQLTNYNDKLYFSVLDSTGRKLWVTNGTDAGTRPAPHNNGVNIESEYSSTPFTVMNDVLYLPGYFSDGNEGLFKYDASNSKGVILVKDFTKGSDLDFLEPSNIVAVDNTVYVNINYSNSTNVYNELWSSQGTESSTKLLTTSDALYNLHSGNGNLYFVKHDNAHGTELWKISCQTGGLPEVQSDVFTGATSSFPEFLTVFKGKILFSAANGTNGYELFMTSNSGSGANLVKDINTVSTSSSSAGITGDFLGINDGMASLGKDVVFNAYERVHGFELYKSNGTDAGTKLLNDITPGEAGDYISLYSSKKDAIYFLTSSSSGYSIYKTTGTKNSLQKITPGYQYNIQTFNIADNGIIFYVGFNPSTYMYELWRTDGTAVGTFLLSSTVYWANYLNIIGNTALFVAGDDVHGYELWKSDGSVSGTKLVKDINPGIDNSTPAGLFLYKNEIYFAAYDGVNHSFWKSDGTKAGTIKLKDADPWWGYTLQHTDKFYFEVSNGILYFSAVQYTNTKGSSLWKTDGTKEGTRFIADINPSATDIYPVPYYYTDVNRTIFFIGDDGVHGQELWKTDGTKQGTKMVKDITPGIDGTDINGLTSFAGKLFFQVAENKDGVYRYYLWTSDCTPEGTYEAGNFGISHIASIFPACDKLYLDVYTYKYGNELYVGKVNDDGKFVVSKVSNEDAAAKATMPFNTVLYPNPAVSKATVRITGDAKDVTLSITDMLGKVLWKSNYHNQSNISLPTEKLSAGFYTVTITSGKESKTIKFVKQ